MSARSVHESPFSGTWYPGDPAELTALLDRSFRDSGERTSAWLAPRAAGFVVPHAGIVYSGAVAASVYRQMAAQQPRRVVVLGFSHRGGRHGLFLPDVDRIHTPLGDVTMDREFAARLAQAPVFQFVAEAAVCDHSIEIQLPLLQRAAPEAKIVPVYVNGPSSEHRSDAAAALAALADPDTVFVASSDFTHYGRTFGFQPFPVDERTSGRLADLDDSVMEAAGSLDPELFLTAIRTTGATFCGHDPIALLLDTLRRLDGPELFQRKLDYRTSGELTGDFHHSVSYGALGYFPHTSFEIDEEGQALLLESARSTLKHLQDTGRRKVIPPARPHPALQARLGAFVTIYVGGNLRGCIGAIKGAEPLSQVVPEMALAAACDDPRFESVTAADGELGVEVSILTPLKRVRGREAFRVNEHGALLKSGHHQGLLLPQVATERGWGAGEFFVALARKAGVAMRAYNAPETELFVFRAQHF